MPFGQSRRPAARASRWLGRRRERAWFAPEVVQTSSMDCGPAALKCLLDGHGVPVSYGRLREACQTSVDGTSIDTIETVALQLGLAAEQVLVPRDFLGLGSETVLPAMVVVRHADSATHFVVVWARHGNWLQIMDPAVGRRWISCQRFEAEIFAHQQSVDANDWRAWCEGEEFQQPTATRLAALGSSEAGARALLDEAAASPGWFGFGALDAAARLCAALVTAGGLNRGSEAAGVVAALFRDTVASGHDIFAIIPPEYWSAKPDITNTDTTREMLLISGGVMLKTGGASPEAVRTEDLPRELAAALTAQAFSPLRQFWTLLREDVAMRPGLIGGAVAVQALALLTQILVFRGLLEAAQHLALPSQRLLALLAVTALVVISGLLDLGLAASMIGQGRRLEGRLRRAILAKLPRLNDRYFQSRPITDMADRSHAIQMVRGVPSLALQAVQVLGELVLTLLAIMVIAPGSAGWALAIAAVAGAAPLLIQPLLNERDLALRNHGGALHGFYLDALLGLAPIRAHRAQRAISGQHESLLVDWTRAARGLAGWALGAQGVAAALGSALGLALLASHFAAQGSVSGSDLLLVFWTLRLPDAAGRVAGLARQYPAMRNALLRQMEPLEAPEEAPGGHTARRAAPPVGPATIALSGGKVVAGGHTILRDLDLSIAAGEHVAIVGRSGAGKSSLLGLLLGWHRLEAGTLLVDGTPLDAAALAQLRLDTAWVDPQVQLWNRSLLDNLTYAVDEQDLSRVRSLVEASGLMGISSRLPEGLQSPLGEGGGLLSGGEGQRVRLGRALLSPSSRLALLDEPFRGLDRVQRGMLLASARRWWKDTTLICVTHDIHETRDFDRVLVIEDGYLVEQGDPRLLGARPGRYRQLLEAEAGLAASRWGSAAWRRWRVADRVVTEAA
jgi:ATP-binding cassette subfamily B protein